MIETEIISQYMQLADVHGCHIRSIYLSGSYPNGYFLHGISDLDILILTEERCDEFMRAAVFPRSLPDGTELDVCVIDIPHIAENPYSNDVRESLLSSKLCGKLIYGDDYVADWEMPDIGAYTRSTIGMTEEFIRRARNYKCSLPDISYPDENERYYGYITLRDGKPSTKLLLSLYMWIATAQLGILKSIRCGCKFECIQYSAQFLSADFSAVVKDVYEHCRNKWGYGVPESEDEQNILKDYCRQLLGYEKDFLKICDEYYR